MQLEKYHQGIVKILLNHEERIEAHEERIEANEDDIQMIDYNSKLVNKMLINLTKEVIINLKEIEKGNSNISLDKINIGDNMVYEIPLSRFTNNIFIGNIGPKTQSANKPTVWENL